MIMNTPSVLTSSQLRDRFLGFFRDHGHTVIPSSSLVPGNDPTLLFTNAGMVQFKDVFLGQDLRPYTRAATSQRCVRAGGKHNDLENVGYTARHHTFFEMLGNFSFGDYFKKDAIRLAWQFITAELKIPKDRLWVTVYETDDEAFDLWVSEAGVPVNRITRMGAQSKFWARGDTGPCGPCSEIFYDHGPEVAGGPPGSPDEDGDRYVEIWNLVFMQYDRGADGALTPLPKPSVDTGMGLERISAVLQGVHSNYDIDLFKALIAAAARVTGVSDLSSPSLRVIADHIRACSFLIVDGVTPSNEGRGYVLRRIIRRAIRHGYQLGQTEPFFHLLVDALVTQMGEAYPELTREAARVRQLLAQEESRFAETLASGMAILDQTIQAQAAQGASRVIPGETVFKLYDTFGFPVDLTADVAREKGFTIDEPGFEAAMNQQRDRARAASRFAVDLRAPTDMVHRSEFQGYDQLSSEGTVLALLDATSQSVNELPDGAIGQVVLDRTAFYAESGGQVGDVGVLSREGSRFQVEDTQKIRDAFAHRGRMVAGTLRVGDRLSALVDRDTRLATARNHSATHLLHEALRRVLGVHVQQKGSLVQADRLRFDFAHGAPMTATELADVEKKVNAEILNNLATTTQLMTYDAALAAGAMALFGEKYGDTVRVLGFGDFSTELCGGTHVVRTGDIGVFKILAETGVAAGVRRMEAVTGTLAFDYLTQSDQWLRQVGQLVRAGRGDVLDKVEGLLDRTKRLERELDQLKARLASGQGTDLASTAVEVRGIKVIAARLDGLDAKALRTAVDQLKEKLGSAVIVLGSADTDGKAILVAGVTADLIGRIKAGDVVARVAAHVGGKGGGRADFAQAGGPNAEQLDAALALVPTIVEGDSAR